MPLSDSFTAGASFSAHLELCMKPNKKAIGMRLRKVGEKWDTELRRQRCQNLGQIKNVCLPCFL
jgi:hypothetical protein